MLAHHHLLEVVEELRPLMTNAGFKRREFIWYRFNTETVQVLEVQPASASNQQRIYFNLGVTLRSLHPPTHFRLFDCPLYGRLDHIMPADEPYSSVTDFSDTTFAEDRLQRIVGFIQRFALPLLDSWQNIAGVNAFTEAAHPSGFIVNASAYRAGNETPDKSKR